MTPRRASSRRGCPAFTLFEVIAVTAVMATLAVFAAASLWSLGGSRAGAASKQVARDLAYARERAMATGTRSWVAFSAGAESYAILIEDPANPGRAGAGAWVDPATGQAHAQAFGTGDFGGVEIVSAVFDGAAEVGFDWEGRPLNSGEAALAAEGVVTLSGGRTVRVEPSSGLAVETGP